MAEQPVNKNIGTDIWGAIPADVKSTIITQLLTGLLGLVGGLFHKKPSTSAPVVPLAPIPFEEEPMVSPPSVPAAPAPVFSASQLDVMDVNGEPYHPESAINWGSYIRFDSNPKDQFGAPLPADQIDPTTGVVSELEWRSTWDGEGGERPEFHVNVGGNLYNQSNGYACSVKVFKHGVEDNKRHVLDVYVRYTLKDGRVVESNEVRIEVD